MPPLVVFDTPRGLAYIAGNAAAAMDAGARGEIRVGGHDGPVLRPIGFGERSRIVTRAATAPDPPASIAFGVWQAALVTPGEADAEVQQILALALAGAGDEAPPFAETALHLAAHAGWSPDQIAAAPAAEMDQLAAALAEPAAQEDDGWNRIVFAAPPGDSSDLTPIVRELAGNLLARAGVSLQGTPPAPEARPEPSYRASLDAEPAREPLSATEPTSAPEQAASPALRPDSTPSATPLRFRLLPYQPDSTVPKPPLNAPAAAMPVVPQTVAAGTPEAAAPAVTLGPAARDRTYPGIDTHVDRMLPTPLATPGRVNKDVNAAAAGRHWRPEQRQDSGVAPLPPAQRGGRGVWGEGSRATHTGTATPGEPALAPADTAPAPPAALPSVTAEQARLDTPDWEETADHLADLLHHEADLRGLDR